MAKSIVARTKIDSIRVEGKGIELPGYSETEEKRSLSLPSFSSELLEFSNAVQS